MGSVIHTPTNNWEEVYPNEDDWTSNQWEANQWETPGQISTVSWYHSSLFNIAKRLDTDEIQNIFTDEKQSHNRKKFIEICCDSRYIDTINYLVNGLRININDYALTIVKRCCENNALDIMKFLIEAGLNIDIPCCVEPYYHIINYVCYTGTCEMIKIFLDNGINADSGGEKLLSILVNEPTKEVFDFIIFGTITNFPQSFFKHHVEKQFEKIKLLIDYGITVQKQNIAALTGAIKKGDAKTIELLVNNGADINCAIQHIQQSQTHNQTINYLVTLGFDPITLATLWFPK